MKLTYITTSAILLSQRLPSAKSACNPSVAGARCPTYQGKLRHSSSLVDPKVNVSHHVITHFVADYLDVEQIIFDWIDDSTCPGRNDLDAPNHWDWDGDDDCVYFPRIRNPRPLGSRLIRHAFHDAAGLNDGHVNLADTENNDGLESSAYVLNAIYEGTSHHGTYYLSTGDEAINEVLNMADFSAWAYIAALKYAACLQDIQEGCQGTEVIPEIPITYGRWSYDADAGHDVEPEFFPEDGGHSSSFTISDYFNTEFGFNLAETATIMGAHTLGGARIEESGFKGMWTQSKNRFNVDYYSAMMSPNPIDCTEAREDPGVGPDEGCIPLSTDLECENAINDPLRGRCQGWELVKVIKEPGDFKFQWQHSCDDNGDGCTHIMLHADMSMFKDIDQYICQVGEDDRGCTAVGEVS